MSTRSTLDTLTGADRPFCRIMDTAREVLREALPIKCIEAVFLGGLLTAGWSGVQRMPLGFKSKVNGEDYRRVNGRVMRRRAECWLHNSRFHRSLLPS
eukprot:366343-Chlamydomonas_euryale.AAC.16